MGMSYGRIFSPILGDVAYLKIDPERLKALADNGR